MRFGTLRRLVVLALVVALVAPIASAAPGGWGGGWSLWDWVWGWANSLLEKTGGSWDPSGGEVQPPQVYDTSGPHIDPFG